MKKGIVGNDDYVRVDCRAQELKYSIKQGNEDEREMTREEIREFLMGTL